jgi:uncharacterized protein YrrD
MEFKRDAEVYTSDGKKAGRLDRVVIDPMSKKVSHLVVIRGTLFHHDKVVPVDWVESTSENRIQLHENEEALDGAPDFTEHHFVEASKPQREAPPDEEPHAVYWNPPVGIDWLGYSGHARRLGFFSHGSPRYTTTSQHPLPADAIPLKEGARVISCDDQYVGDVERIFTEPKENLVTHLLISAGLHPAEKKVIPTFWIAGIEEEEVHLAVEADVLRRLEKPADQEAAR